MNLPPLFQMLNEPKSEQYNLTPEQNSVCKKKKTVQIHIQISPDLKSRLMLIAEQEGLSLTDLLVYRALDYDNLRSYALIPKTLSGVLPKIEQTFTKFEKKLDKVV